MTARNNPEILEAAIELVRAGRKEEARQLLQRLIREDPKRENVWLWFVETLPDPAMRIAALRECLRHNPGSQHARNGLALLGTGPKPGEAPQPASPPKKTSTEKPPAHSPVPAVQPAVQRSSSGGGSTQGKPVPLSRSSPKNPPSRDKGARQGPPPAFRAASNQPVAPRRKSGLLRLFLIGSFLVIAVVAAFTWVISTNPGLQNALVEVLAANTNIGKLIKSHNALAGTGTPASTGTPGSATRTAAAGTTSIRTATPTLKPTATPKPTNTSTPTMTSTPSSTPTPTIFAGEPGDREMQLFFLAPGACEAMRVSISGGGPELLTTNPISDCSQARLSPDGKRLAFIDQTNRQIIQTVNLDGSGRKEVTRIKDVAGVTRTIWSLDWSRDGKKIAFQATSTTNAECGGLYVIPATGSNYPKTMKTRCLERTAAEKLTWSPDSRWLLSFDQASASDTTLYPFAFRESDSRVVQIALTDAGSSDAHYEWSPDSTSVVHLAALPESSDPLTLVVSTLSEEKSYIALPSSDYDAAFGAVWTPDGASFLLYDTKKRALIFLNSEGIVENLAIALGRAPALVRWSSGGQWLAILEPGNSEESDGALIIVRRDGSDLRILAYGVNTGALIWK